MRRRLEWVTKVTGGGGGGDIHNRRKLSTGDKISGGSSFAWCFLKATTDCQMSADERFLQIPRPFCAATGRKGALLVDARDVSCALAPFYSRIHGPSMWQVCVQSGRLASYSSSLPPSLSSSSDASSVSFSSSPPFTLQCPPLLVPFVQLGRLAV